LERIRAVTSGRKRHIRKTGPGKQKRIWHNGIVVRIVVENGENSFLKNLPWRSVGLRCCWFVKFFGQVGAPLLQIPASILLRIPIVNLHQCRQSGASARNKNLPAPKTHKMELPLPTQFGPDRFIESERRDQPNESDDLQQNAKNNGQMFVNRSDSVNALKYGKGRRTDEWCQEKQEETVTITFLGRRCGDLRELCL
jgi:hypothetical protein